MIKVQNKKLTLNYLSPEGLITPAGPLFVYSCLNHWHVNTSPPFCLTWRNKVNYAIDSAQNLIARDPNPVLTTQSC